MQNKRNLYITLTILTIIIIILGLAYLLNKPSQGYGAVAVTATKSCNKIATEKGYTNKDSIKCNPSSCSKDGVTVNLGQTSDCGACCVKKAGAVANTQVDIKTLTCGAVGGLYGIAQTELKCEATSCANGYDNLGQSKDCKACCTKVASTTSQSCGAIGYYKGVAENDLRCESKSCGRDYTNLGQSKDCKACCAKTKELFYVATSTVDANGKTISNMVVNSPSVISTTSSPIIYTLSCGSIANEKGYRQEDLKCTGNNTCPGGYSNLGKTKDCTACCVKSTTQTCGSIAYDKGYSESEIKCEAKKCPKNYVNLGKSSDCNSCCTKYISWYQKFRQWITK